MARTTWANPAKVQPHIPVATKEPRTCGECGHHIGFNAEHDPVHAVPRPCIWRCGTEVPPFWFECTPCADQKAARQERERLARLATYKTETVSDDDTAEPGKRRSSSGEQAPMDPERKRRFNEAVAYIRDYTGTWGLVLDLRANPKWGTKWFRLSDRQVEVLLQAKERDAQRAIEAAERKATGLDLNGLPPGTTRYAVENASGEVTFIRVDRVTTGKWEGWVFVKQVVGGGAPGMDNEQRLGSQRPGDAYRGSFERLLQKVVADPLEAARRYGLELGTCSDCGRTLTNAESREYGIGPVCRGKWSAAA